MLGPFLIILSVNNRGATRRGIRRQCEEGRESGVPQSSVLGPFLILSTIRKRDLNLGYVTVGEQ